MNLTKLKKLTLLSTLALATNSARAEVVGTEKVWGGTKVTVVQESKGMAGDARSLATKNALNEVLGFIPYHSTTISEVGLNQIAETKEIKKSAVIYVKTLEERYKDEQLWSKFEISILDGSDNRKSLEELEEYVKTKTLNKSLLPSVDKGDPFVEAELNVLEFFKEIKSKVQISKTVHLNNITLNDKNSLIKRNQSLPIFTVDYSGLETILRSLQTKVPGMDSGMTIFSNTGRASKNRMMNVTFKSKFLHKNPRAYEFALFLSRQVANVELYIGNQFYSYPVAGIGDKWSGNNLYLADSNISFSRELCGNALNKQYPDLSEQFKEKWVLGDIKRLSYVETQFSLTPIKKIQYEVSYTGGSTTLQKIKTELSKEVLGTTEHASTIELPQACVLHFSMEKKEVINDENK